MFKKLILALVAALALTLGFAAPSHAVVGTGYIAHVSDDGYDAPFLVVRQWIDGYAYGTVYEIAEGSARGDVAGIYVRPGEKIVCKAGSYWYVAWDAAGWYRVGDNTFACVAQLD